MTGQQPPPYNLNMTGEDVQQELDRVPFEPLRLHLASGKVIDVVHPWTAWVRQSTLLVVHPLKPLTSKIQNDYDVIALRQIERIELVNGNRSARKKRRR